MTRAPPSTIRLEISSFPRKSRRAARSISSLLLDLMGITRAPFCCNILRREVLHLGEVMIQGIFLLRSAFAFCGVLNVRSRIMGCGSKPWIIRTLSRGSSDKIVPMPTSMASWAALSLWHSRNDSLPLRESRAPRCAAMLPSRLCA